MKSKTEDLTMLRLAKSMLFTFVVTLIAVGATPKVGESAPQFSLPASDGLTVSLKDFAGKKLVLVFYRGYW
jgi:peroxiredoxin